MNEEYLWQKTGSDPEIERLEETLAVFRYRESVPAEVPAKLVEDGERTRRWRFPLVFAFASCVAIAVAAFVWNQLPGETNGSANDLVFVAGPDDPATNPPPVIEHPTPAVRNSEPPARPKRSSGVKINPTTASSRRQPKLKDAAPKDNIAALTDEERYAYRQLILALAITGSNLKIVQDAIDGTDTDRNQR